MCARLAASIGGVDEPRSTVSGPEAITPD